jgi:hypothetical protein
MNGTEAVRFLWRRAAHGVALLAGAALLAGVRRLALAWHPTLLGASLIEEGLKGLLFLLLALALRVGGGKLGSVAAPEFLPFVCVVGFGVAENLLYFLEAPTTSIYERLLYAYPVHLNTALLYTLAFVSGRPLLAVPAAVAGVAYHFGLNVVSLVAPQPVVLALGAANLLAFACLTGSVHAVRVKRSVTSCWIPI